MNEKQLVAYITSGLPDNNFSIDLCLSMAENGVDMIELGVPFSDPVADGPVIEKANFQALQKGVKFEDVKAITQAISSTVDTLWMGYFNSFYHQGMEKLLPAAKALGLTGMIIPDLPHEEARTYSELFKDNCLANIAFVAPTDSDERVKEVLADAQKFIYMVAYAGITGSGKKEELSGLVASVKRHSQTPVYVGFGVNAQTAKEKAQGVDGVIVGSAFVDILLQDNLSNTQKIENISRLAKEIKEKIND
jgi:tryptophan synthase alpha chain